MGTRAPSGPRQGEIVWVEDGCGGLQFSAGVPRPEDAGTMGSGDCRMEALGSKQGFYSSGHTLRTPFGKRMVETSAAECVLSIHLEHLKKHTLRTCSKRYLEHFGVIYVF